jgi:hypothetical protein
MESVGNDRRDLVRGIYEQHCSHVKHAENQRLWFTIIYALLSAGCLVVMNGNLFYSAFWPIVGFLMILSLFGLIFCLGIQSALKAYTDAADLILTRYSLTHYLPRYRANSPHRLFGVSKLFPLFYLLLFAFFLFVLLQMGLCSIWKSIPLPLLVCVIGTVALFVSKFDEPAEPDED